MKKNKQLGQGLGALLTPSKNNLEDSNQSSILLSKIKPNPNQPRKNFADKSLKQLAQSINEKGLISPITVKKVENKYIIVAGERRYRAHKLLNKKRILAYVIDADTTKDVMYMALIENIQREDLNPVEEARGLDRLKREFGLTQDEVASSTGKARSTIANSLRILSLPASVLDMLSDGLIEQGHAKLLASLDSKEAEDLAKKIVKEKLSIKDLSGLTSKKPTNKNAKQKTKDTDILNVEQEMSESFGHKIEIDTKNKNAGRVSILYKTLDELDSIIQKLKNK